MARELDQSELGAGRPRRTRIRCNVEPRDVPPDKAARRLGLTLAQFEVVRERLLARGFPPPDPDTGNYDLVAIDRWMDGRDALTRAKAPRDAQEVFGERARRLLHG